MNDVKLTGRLGQDPEVKHLDSGKTVANFSLAVDDGYGEKKNSFWFRISAWEKTAEFVEKYLFKGSKVLVSGRLVSRQFEDKDGNNRTVVEVVANHIEPFTWREVTTVADQNGESVDDIPF